MHLRVEPEEGVALVSSEEGLAPVVTAQALAELPESSTSMVPHRRHSRLRVLAVLLGIALLFALSLGTLIAVPGRASLSASSRPVHIVMFLADDLGWADVDWHRDDAYPERATPALDQLRREGVELNRAYAFKYCAPSRAALLSGRHPIHVTVLNTDPGVRNPLDDESGFAGIPRSMTCIATLLKRAGYRTHFTGKWDVGERGGVAVWSVRTSTGSALSGMRTRTVPAVAACALGRDGDPRAHATRKGLRLVPRLLLSRERLCAE